MEQHESKTYKQCQTKFILDSQTSYIYLYFKDPLIMWPGTYKSCRPYLSKPHYARTYFWVCSLQVMVI